MSFRLQISLTGLVALISTSLLSNVALAQEAMPDVHEWRLVKKQVFEDKVIEEPQLISETKLEKVKTKRMRPVWNTETRQRRIVTKKPIQETKFRVERRTVMKPVEVTKYRERVVSETEYEEVTRYRDETYTVQRPIVETEVREETVTVKRPVVENLVEVKRTTTYKPVTEKRTEYVQKPGTFNYAVQADTTQRPRLRYLSPGYYTDPTTGLTVYRRRGLHWATPNAVVPVVETPPSVVPTERLETRYVPETTESRRPVEVTRMVEKTETRRVPVQVERMVERTETRKVPYTVKEPIVRRRVEKVPYTETEYREEIIEERVPYTETVMREEVRYEPYEVEVGKWVEEEVTEEVPRQVSRQVMKKVTRSVPKDVWMKAPFDINGNQIGEAIPLTDSDAGLIKVDAADRAPAIDSNIGEGTTLGQPPRERINARKIEMEDGTTSVLVPTGRKVSSAMEPIGGDKATTESSENQSSVAGNDEVPAATTPTTPEEAGVSETGNEDAADGVSKK